MKHRDYVNQQRSDPEYLSAEAELRPVLDLAESVIRLRVERGWSQKELARKLGIWQANISRLEHGQANPTLDTLTKLSKVFGVDLVVRLGNLEPLSYQESQAEPTLTWTILPSQFASVPVSGTHTHDREFAVYCPNPQEPRISA